MKLKKLTQLSLFTTIAVTIFMLESALPVLIPIPGVKLGLSNVVTLFLLLHYTKKEAFLVLLARIMLSGIFAGQLIYFLYSFLGGLLSFLVMSGMNSLLRGQYIYITSIFGSIFHNIGQLLTALVLLRSLSILTFVPLLLISAILTGLFTGLCTHYFTKKLWFRISDV